MIVHQRWVNACDSQPANEAFPRTHLSMKILLLLSLLFSLSASAQEKVPAVFADYLVPDVAVKGEVVAVVPPEAIEKYIAKVDIIRKKDPEWFSEYSKNAQPGVPLPFNKKLGLTKAEYEEYLKLWDQREMKPLPQGELIVRLEKAGDKWRIRVTGQGSDITTMFYDPKTDDYTTTSGTLKRIDDIKADKRSILGE